LGVEGLFELRTGFRAKYIYDAVSRTLDGSISFTEVMAESDIEKAIAALCAVKGIGRKVASCALLFGFQKYNAFPVDVWMKRVALKYFRDEGENLSWQRFGAYAGIAQQYLFYYERYRSIQE
jgi:N-glycosylase/DNA lyase